MSIPHKCPVCEGRGEIGKRLAQVGAILISAKPQRFRCHGCYATGIVWDTSFNLSPGVIPWGTTDQMPTIGGGSITYTNDGDATLPYVQTEWRESNVEINDGVTRCKDCEEPLYLHPAKGCQRKSSHSKQFDVPKGSSCACSPIGEEHSDNCKGAEW